MMDVCAGADEEEKHQEERLEIEKGRLGHTSVLHLVMYANFAYHSGCLDSFLWYTQANNDNVDVEV
jgi:hypothetical protein